jgi:hypothetical protein
MNNICRPTRTWTHFNTHAKLLRHNKFVCLNKNFVNVYVSLKYKQTNKLADYLTTALQFIKTYLCAQILAPQRDSNPLYSALEEHAMTTLPRRQSALTSFFALKNVHGYSKPEKFCDIAMLLNNTLAPRVHMYIHMYVHKCTYIYVCT